MNIRAKKTHKRFHNMKDFELLKNGRSLGYFHINEKDKENELAELKGFVELTGADKIILRWTAIEGFVNKEVSI